MPLIQVEKETFFVMVDLFGWRLEAGRAELFLYVPNLMSNFEIARATPGTSASLYI